MSDLVERLLQGYSPEKDEAVYEAIDRIETLQEQVRQLEAALTLIAGSSSDRLQALQAVAALDNIGAKASK